MNNWLDEICSYCLEEIAMSAIIPETCFQCGCLLDECVCQEYEQ